MIYLNLLYFTSIEFPIRLIHYVRYAHFVQNRYAIVSKISHAHYVRCIRFIRFIRCAHSAQNLMRSIFSLSSAHYVPRNHTPPTPPTTADVGSWWGERLGSSRMSVAEWENRAHEVLSGMSAANVANKPNAANEVSVWDFRNDSEANLSEVSVANEVN